VFEVRLKNLISRVLFGWMFADYFDSMLDLFAVFECEGLFNDTETAYPDLAANNVWTDFLTFIVRGRSGRGCLGKARKPLQTRSVNDSYSLVIPFWQDCREHCRRRMRLRMSSGASDHQMNTTGSAQRHRGG
jgi:hypothetical protein